MFKKIIASTATAGLLVAAVAATTSPAESRAPLHASHRTPKEIAINAPPTVVAGKTFNVVVRTGHLAGRVTLLRSVPGGEWKAVDHQRADKSLRSIAFGRVERSAGRVRFKAQIRGLFTRIDRVVVTEPAGPMLIMGAGTASGEDVFVGDAYTVFAALSRGEKPIVGQQVLVERQDPGSSTWTAVGTFTTDDQGEASFVDQSDQRGLVHYRGTSGRLSGQTAVPVFEVVSMPPSAGGEVTVSSQGCGATTTGDGDQVNLALHSTRPKPDTPACKVQVGDFVQVTWQLPGMCTPVSFQNFAFDGSTGAGINVLASIDGQEVLDRDLAPLGQTGKLVISGDPPEDLTVRMRVTQGAGGQFVGMITQPDATCL